MPADAGLHYVGNLALVPFEHLLSLNQFKISHGPPYQDNATMANILLAAWPDSAPKNALAPLGPLLLLFLALVSTVTAQVEREGGSTRKVVRTVEPDYPKIVKNAHIGGSVRLNVTVLASSDVAKVEPLGGNPVFVESATKAVLKWKYARAASQTKEEVQINFKPD